MKKSIYINLTFYADCPSLNRYYVSVHDHDDPSMEGIELTSYEEAMNELRKAEKALGRAAKLSVNPFSRKIWYKEIYGEVGA